MLGNVISDPEACSGADGDESHSQLTLLGFDGGVGGQQVTRRLHVKIRTHFFLPGGDLFPAADAQNRPKYKSAVRKNKRCCPEFGIIGVISCLLHQFCGSSGVHDRNVQEKGGDEKENRTAHRDNEVL